MSDLRPIRNVLVANRGEIAVRVERACRDLGIATVAVYSEADRGALHVQLADQAVCIGPPPARQSYLDVERILDAAARTGADAVHPGYGFLAENAEFAAACERAGLVFIGPPAEAIREMGDKTVARRRMRAAGVPVVPGAEGPGGRGFEDPLEALAAAHRVGFPVMLKAAAGGGGKGMRLVHEPERFAAAYAAARREALGAFGDGAVYVEKFVERPRHVEVQVFADAAGHTVHLFERDCSIQRRHQKVIEETPSPAVGADLAERMGAVAVQAARAVGYRGAGTIEFLLGPSGDFYFLEMNTRLQVEHPVTEMVTSLDLVRLQIRVAEGRPLGFEQGDVVRRGAAVECRVYAEDPETFLPSPGRVTGLRVPSGPWVRRDSGVELGSEISVHYDPLIAKLVTWGAGRADALARMGRALGEYRVAGVRTNIPLLARVVAHPAFAAGAYDTGFLERHREELRVAPAGPGDGEAGGALDVALAAAAIHAAGASAPAPATDAGGVPAWRAAARWGRRS